MTDPVACRAARAFLVRRGPQNTALEAFQFCLKYERKSEFRRLCEMLRTHLGNLTKYSHQVNAVNLNNAESLQLHMETRFAQLNTAVQLELWQESSRTVDDLFGLMRQSRTPLKSSVMAAYYDKMAQIFLVSDNWLMHAFAFKRQFQKSANKLAAPERKTYVGAAAAVWCGLAHSRAGLTRSVSLAACVLGEGCERPWMTHACPGLHLRWSWPRLPPRWTVLHRARW